MNDFIINHINKGWTLRIFTKTKQAAICFKYGRVIDVDYNRAVELLTTAAEYGFAVKTFSTLRNYYEINV